MKLILYGAGYWGEHALSYFGADNVFCFCDSKIKGDAEGELDGKKIISFQKLTELYKHEECVVIVCAGSNYTEEISNQLDSVGIHDYFAYDVLHRAIRNVPAFIEQLQNPAEREKLFRRYYKLLAASIKDQFEYLKRHVDITTLMPATGSLRKKQLALVDFVVDFFEFIKELEIKPFLTFGNLVGAFRHQGFIPWDDDMDFGMMRYEFEKLLEFAERNCIVGTFCNDIWVDKSETRMTRAEVFRKYPNEYIFDIRSNMVQVYKGSYDTENPGIDIWIYDFYKEKYEIAEHKKWIHSVEEKVRLLECEKEKVDFIRKERLNNPMISMEEEKYFYPGMDNWGGYPGLKNVDSWILTKDIFPLKRVKYEDVEFWAPRDMEALLKHEYPSYMDFPYDMGRPLHGVLDES